MSARHSHVNYGANVLCNKVLQGTVTQTKGGYRQQAIWICVHLIYSYEIAYILTE